MKKISAILLSCILLANSVFANTWGTDWTDLWWNANESGWGVTTTHQGEVVFLTFFVYGPDNRPAWYTGQTSYSSTNAQGAFIFTGPLYQTNGPWLGTVFNPNAVGVRQVGTATFTAFITSGTLTYIVDGIQVSKSITRQTFRTNQVNAQLLGAFRQVQSGCRFPYGNGTYIAASNMSLVITANNLQMITSDLSTSSSCTYSGNYTQAGRMGRSSGTYACTGGVSGSYDAYEIEATWYSISGRFSANDNYCTVISGRFAALER